MRGLPVVNIGTSNIWENSQAIDVLVYFASKDELCDKI